VTGRRAYLGGRPNPPPHPYTRTPTVLENPKSWGGRGPPQSENEIAKFSKIEIMGALTRNRPQPKSSLSAACSDCRTEPAKSLRERHAKWHKTSSNTRHLQGLERGEDEVREHSRQGQRCESWVRAKAMGGGCKMRGRMLGRDGNGVNVNRG